MLWIGIGLLAAAAAVIWMRRGRHAPPEADEIDRAVLDAAEREVRDLGIETTPNEADEALPDWGPGAP